MAIKYLILIILLSLNLYGRDLQETKSSPKVLAFEFFDNDGWLRARVFLNDKAVLVDYPIQQRAFLFESDSYAYLNRSEKKYTVHSYSAMLENLPKDADTSALRSPNVALESTVAGFQVTEETEVIAGLTAQKCVWMSQDELRAEIWVSEEIPEALRAVGKDLRSILPRNRWKNDDSLPSAFELLLAFGLPLRIVDHTDAFFSLEAKPMDTQSITDDAFTIPSEYRRNH